MKTFEQSVKDIFKTECDKMIMTCHFWNKVHNYWIDELDKATTTEDRIKIAGYMGAALKEAKKYK